MDAKYTGDLKMERATVEKSISANSRTGEVVMTRFEATERIHVMQEVEMNLFDNGQDDYARDMENVFGNFVRLADMLNLSPEAILMVYAVKHLDGVLAWINGHDSGRESVKGRINDLRVYLAILSLMVDAYENASTEG